MAGHTLSVNKGLNANERSVLDKFTYDEPTDTIIATASIRTQPSSLYLGNTFRLSNGVQVVSYVLADGTHAVGLVNRYGENGSLSNPVFHSIGAREALNINLDQSTELPVLFEVNYTTAGDNLTFDFDIVPADSGRLRVEYWLGNDDTGAKIFDQSRWIEAAEVNTVVNFSLGNPYIIDGGTDIFVRFSGVPLMGNAAQTLPYFVSRIQPFKEVAIGAHTECLGSDFLVEVGCDYAVDTTAGQVTMTVPETFTNNFTVFDEVGNFSTNNCIVDFSAFTYPVGHPSAGQSMGNGTLSIDGDNVKFYYNPNKNLWYWINNITNEVNEV